MILASACQEDYFPPGLLGYQVERLLSADTSKTWNLQSTVDECDVAQTLLFVEAMDSVEVIAFRDNCDGTSIDSVYLGTASASEFDEIFTDSLIFYDGSIWLIDQITSQFLDIRIGTDQFSYYVNQ
ncbi:MAG: hypothetical protein JXQ90_22645 [Cyclobacteriaceae bacterium]